MNKQFSTKFLDTYHFFSFVMKFKEYCSFEQLIIKEIDNKRKKVFGRTFLLLFSGIFLFQHVDYVQLSDIYRAFSASILYGGFLSLGVCPLFHDAKSLNHDLLNRYLHEQHVLKLETIDYIHLQYDAIVERLKNIDSLFQNTNVFEKSEHISFTQHCKIFQNVSYEEKFDVLKDIYQLLLQYKESRKLEKLENFEQLIGNLSLEKEMHINDYKKHYKEKL